MITLRPGLGCILVAAIAGCSAPEPSSSAEAAEQGTAVFTWNDALNVFPASLSDEPAQNWDANFCELYVNGFGEGNSSNDGATVRWLEAYLSVPAQQGQLLDVAMYTRAAQGDVITLAVPIAPNYWRTGFTSYRSAPGMGGGPNDDPVTEFAFFVDVRRENGEVVRLWQSDHGKNYTMGEVFASPPSGVVGLGNGSVTYASNDSPLFHQRQACR
jgi:hypothetical protein